AASRAELAAALEAARSRVAASAAALVQAPQAAPVPQPAPQPAPQSAPAAQATPAPATIPAPATTPAPPVLTVVPDPVDADEAAAPEADFSHPELDAVRDELAEAGVDPRYLDPFIEGFRRNAVPFLAEDADVREAVRQALAARLPVSRDWKGRPKGQALAFVGQSGVGKSTVVRKLAWRLHQAGRSVTIIAAGDEPDAAVASLAERLGIRYEHAADAESLAQARTAASDAEADIVLIDTPGRSHTNLDEMEELGRLLSLARVEEVHLVMPVAVPLADLGDLSRRFRIAGVNRITLTKQDETRLLGNLVNVPLRLSKPLAFLADGTSATAHLRPVDPHFVAGVLLP
ncbi:MAG: hypothetical protein KDC33_02120, partial [Thermoleophilia bacterium]|nr:hypothetical protein [Thermoleophilia bacterium]